MIIIYKNGNFYYSDINFIDPNFAFATDPLRFEFIGSKGWFGTPENKELYEKINSIISLDGWQDGEYDMISL